MGFEELRQLQAEAGASISEDGTVLRFESAQSDEAALAAARSGVALADRTHWGRIRVTGADRLKFLHNQTTNNFQALKPGQGCETVFVTSTARTLDLASALVLEDEVLLLVSPGQAGPLIQFCDRYIFFDDAVKLTDVTEDVACFTLVGPESLALVRSLLAQSGAEANLEQPLHSHQLLQLQLSEVNEPSELSEVEVRIAVGSDLALPGYTLFCPAEQAARLWRSLTQASATPLGAAAWEQLRIEQGRPAAGQELTEEYNPLEAGLWQTVSFEKGCYIGQETIARLNTYNGVKQRLFGLKLDEAVAPGTPLTDGEKKVGTITSMAQTAVGYSGLAYVRTKAGGEGMTIQVGEKEALVVELPYTHHPESVTDERGHPL